MCWFSTEHADKIEEAKSGQRLGIRRMHLHANWVVRETELETPRACPVCLQEGTRILFRFTEVQQASLGFGSEAKAVFRMLERPKRDVFEFADGKQIILEDLPPGLIFDVLVVPGLEHLSAVLDTDQAVWNEEEPREEPLWGRLLTRF